MERTVSGQDLGYAHEGIFHKVQLVTKGIMNTQAVKPNVRTLCIIQGPGPTQRAESTKCMNVLKDLVRDKPSVRQFREMHKPLDRVIIPSKMLEWTRNRCKQQWKPALNQVNGGNPLCMTDQALLAEIKVPVQQYGQGWFLGTLCRWRRFRHETQNASSEPTHM